MNIEPTPGKHVMIENQEFVFEGIPGYPNIVYAEIGRKAKVYRIKNSKTSQFFGLKAFFQEFRGPIKDNERLQNAISLRELFQRQYPTESAKYGSGIWTALSSVIIPDRNPSFVKQFPQFSFSLLMNWMQGEAWSNIILNKQPITAENSLKLSRALALVLAGLESRGLAHCDLSGNNIIFSNNYSHVELIDIDEMFWPGRSKPTPLPAGTEGYVPLWVQKRGLWNPYCDRIAGAILLSEILAWRFVDIRNCRFDTSFFTSREFGFRSSRYNLLSRKLANISIKLQDLFEAVWFNKNDGVRINDLPPLSEWKTAIESI